MPPQPLRARLVLPADADATAWHEQRLLGLGGSDAAAACGLNPHKPIYPLWLEKTGRLGSEADEDNENMYWGRTLEPVLLEEFDRRHDELILTGGEGTYADPDRGFMLANVDGLAYYPDGTLAGVVEVKTGTHRAAPRWDDEAVPEHYVCQAQWYMAVLGAPRAYVVALLDTATYLERILERDDELITDLIEAGEEFWRYVETDTAPPVDGSEATRRTLAHLRAADDEAIELDGSWDKHLDRRHELTEQITALGAERDVLDNELRAVMGPAEIALRDGAKVASHKAGSKPRRSCDYDTLAASYPDAYAAVITEKPASRRLTYAAWKEST